MNSEEIRSVVEQLRVIRFLLQRDAELFIEETLATCCSEEGDW